MRNPLLMLLIAILLGAILWIALGNQDPEHPAESVPGAAQRAPQPEDALRADADTPADGALQAPSERPGALRVRLTSDVERPWRGMGASLTLQGEDDQAGSVWVIARTPPATFQHKALGWKGAPTCTLDGADIVLEFPKIPRGRWTLTARTVDGDASLKAVPVSVDVGADGADASIRLARELSMAYVRVNVVQASTVIPEATVRVHLDAAVIARGNSVAADAPDDEGWIAVPPGKPLSVQVTRYRGSSAFGGLPPVEVELAVNERRELVFEVPVGRAARFRAVSRHGESVAYGLVLWRHGTGRPQYVDVMDVARPEGQAGWVAVLPEGRYRVLVAPSAHYARAYAEVEVVASTEEQVFDVPVDDKGVRVTIVLESPDSARSAKQRMNLNRITTDPGDADFFGGQTDAKGRLVSRPLTPGRYRMFLWNLNLAREVDASTDTTHVFEVPPPLPAENKVVIRGTVTMPDGSRANGVYVHARAAGSEWDRLGRANADGRFEIAGLEPGVYEVYVPVRLLDRQSYRAGRRTVQVGTTSTTITVKLER